ncbi:N/A [soil metagenome]
MVSLAVVVVDQFTKRWALSALDDGPIDLVWTLRLRLTFNTGSAFSLGSGRGGLIAVLGIVVVAAVFWFGRTVTGRQATVALALVLGGAVGNLADHFGRAGDGGLSGALSGAVVDFIDLQWWPVFNLADVAIVVGGLALLAVSAREPRR